MNECAKKASEPIHSEPEPSSEVSAPSDLWGLWGEDGTCPHCGKNVYDGIDADIWSRYAPPFCPNCGKSMSVSNT